jgi:hypothetical protein
MTSVLRRYAQIEPRIQYFSVFPLSTVDGWTLNTNKVASPLMDISSFLVSFTNTPAKFNDFYLLKDLGRQITVYNTTIVGDPHVAVFRQVMQVNGPGIEGISSNIAYICVWTAGLNPSFVAAPVARTG